MKYKIAISHKLYLLIYESRATLLYFELSKLIEAIKSDDLLFSHLTMPKIGEIEILAEYDTLEELKDKMPEWFV